MSSLARTDQSIIGKWWWTVDRWTLATILLLVGFGILLIQAATPAIAEMHNLNTFYFVERHLIMLIPALGIMIGLSLLSPRQLLLVSLSLGFLFLLCLLATPFIGAETKGAVRWIQLPFISFQPSEFVKPFFTVIAAWLFARHCGRQGSPGFGANIALFMIVCTSLLMQPDVGMTALICVIWFGQFFLAGLPLIVTAALPLLATIGIIAAYYTFPHFASRFDRFLTNSGDTYQTDKALEAFTNGGLFGTGPGAGTVKMKIPDVHADFIFAVAGEELGMIGALVIICLFTIIILRGIWKVRTESNLFILLAVAGLLIQFGVQTAINLGSTLNLIPAKGMTLPFISYGGSSLWAMSISMGLLLGLTKKRYGLSDI